MNVKKIFMLLITVVACVMLGAFALNVILPNATTAMVSSTEDMVFKATGMAFDVNSDGKKGSAVTNATGYTGTKKDATTGGATGGAGVTGFK